MLKPRRKERIEVFEPSRKRLTTTMLLLFFIAGLVISILKGFRAAMAYIVMWLASYLVIFKGTCTRCAYYGKSCPIPLEGPLVKYFFKKSDKPFGYKALFWATVAYLMRIWVPSLVIIRDRRKAAGIIYYGMFKIFWVIHLRIIGCPNCINSACPLNPD